MPFLFDLAPMTPAHTTLADLRAGRLAGATHLDLRHAGLTEFPREIFALADTLEFLDLSSNALRDLPADFDRLHALRTLFCSNCAFTELPAVLGRCARLDLVGFKANAIEHVPAQALSPNLRWLILSGNRVAVMPETLGRCAHLRKLALAGNRLTALPQGIAGCERLELIRLSANRFEAIEDALPDGLLALPRLAWLAYAGNPFNVVREAAAIRSTPIAQVAWSTLDVGVQLGEGASGFIHAARWRREAASEDVAVAVKLFKGEMTSDGLPASEMAACIAADAHAHVIGVEGQVVGHPRDVQGLVMRLIPPTYRSLAAPPSLASCTRDVYADGVRFAAAQARAIATGMRDALAHLHACGLLHGDFYAHNILVDDAGHALLGDFGAASFLPEDDAVRREALQRIDRRALGVLVEELAVRCEDGIAAEDLLQAP